MTKPSIFDDAATDTWQHVVFQENDDFGEEPLTHANLGSLNGNHLPAYYPGDTPQDSSISGEHQAVYIDGALSKNSKITLRQSIVSAKALAENAEVLSSKMLIISNAELSKQSKNFTDYSKNHPMIVIVPEAQRAELFSEMCEDKGFGLIRTLKKYIYEHPRVPITIEIHGQHYQELEELGILGRQK